AVETQNVSRLLHRPEDRPGEHLCAEWDAVELELRDDSEVAASAAEAPEQIGVLVLACLDELAPGSHDIHRDELIDREPVLAHDPADSAAERQARDARVSDDAGRNRETERLRLPVELAEQHAGLHPRRAPFRIDAHALHR